MGGSMERNRVDLTMDCLARDREVEMAWKVCACGGGGENCWQDTIGVGFASTAGPSCGLQGIA